MRARAKPNWRYSQQLLQVFIHFLKRLNARLDEAHLLIHSKKNAKSSMLISRKPVDHETCYEIRAAHPHSMHQVHVRHLHLISLSLESRSNSFARTSTPVSIQVLFLPSGVASEQVAAWRRKSLLCQWYLCDYSSCRHLSTLEC